MADRTDERQLRPGGERDPNAVRLLRVSRAERPDTPGALGRYQVTSPNINNTRQEVIRVDYDFSTTQRLSGRYCTT